MRRVSRLCLFQRVDSRDCPGSIADDIEFRHVLSGARYTGFSDPKRVDLPSPLLVSILINDRRER
jgi:hypothetical protein